GGPGCDPPRVLEEATGSVNFLVVAVDNENDRAIYVGPVYSYYEFAVSPDNRLSDEAWIKKLQNKDTPERPRWVRTFQPPARERRLGDPVPDVQSGAPRACLLHPSDFIRAVWVANSTRVLSAFLI